MWAFRDYSRYDGIYDIGSVLIFRPQEFRACTRRVRGLRLPAPRRLVPSALRVKLIWGNLAASNVDCSICGCGHSDGIGAISISE